MTDIVHNWAVGLGGIAFIAVIFGWNYWFRGAISKWLVSILPLQRTMPLRRVDLLVRVPLYGVPGLIGYILLSILDPSLVIPFHFTLYALLNGVVLGIGVLAAGQTLSWVVYTQTTLWRRNRFTSASDEMIAFTETGWLRGYNILRHTFPFVGYPLIAISVVGEEAMFRALIFSLLAKGFNPTIGLILSTLAFVGIQRMNLPNWSLALIPMSAACVMGIIHSYIALTTMNMVPLFVSHYIFFIAAVLLSSTSKENKSKEPVSSWYQQNG